MYPTPQNIQVDKLFQPGERWGWETWNPQDFVKPFPNQPPVRPKGLTGSIWSKGAMWSSPIGQIFQIWFIAIIVIILTLIIPSKVGPSDAVIRLFVITLVLVLALRYTLPWIVYIIKMQQWKNEKYAHDVAEQNFINSLPIYGTVAPWAGTRRVDVYGGTSTSWQALLTTYGGSCLASGNHLTIIDLSEEGVAEALTQLAMRRLFTVNTLHLPQQLPQFDAFANLTPTEIKDVLIETIYGDQKDGSSRHNRASDDRILDEVCTFLAPRVTVNRILAALRSMVGQGPPPPEKDGVLSPDEWFQVKEIFKDGVLKEMLPRIFALENQLYPLRLLGSNLTKQEQADYQLRTITLNDGGTTLLNDFIVDLLPQLIIRSLRSVSGRALNQNVFIVVGADTLPRRHLERLSKLSQNRGVRLVYLFKHLREDTVDVLGNNDSAAFFMNLGNAAEATKAAEYIGKAYKFELSQKTSGTSSGTTRTYGISETHTQGSSGSFLNRNNSTSDASGTSMSDANNFASNESTTVSRVYEYVVEPMTLQRLQEASFLLVQHDTRGGGTFIKEGNCSPNILTLNGVSLTPLVLPARPTSTSYH